MASSSITEVGKGRGSHQSGYVFKRLRYKRNLTIEMATWMKCDVWTNTTYRRQHSVALFHILQHLDWCLKSAFRILQTAFQCMKIAFTKPDSWCTKIACPCMETAIRWKKRFVDPWKRPENKRWWYRGHHKKSELNGYRKLGKIRGLKYMDLSSSCPRSSTTGLRLQRSIKALDFNRQRDLTVQCFKTR